MKMRGVFVLQSVFQPKNASVALSVGVVMWLAQLMWQQTEIMQKDQVQKIQNQIEQQFPQQAPSLVKINLSEPLPAPAPVSVRLPEPPVPVIEPAEMPPAQPVFAAQALAPDEVQPQPTPDQTPDPMPPRTLDNADPVLTYPPLRPTLKVKNSTPQPQKPLQLPPATLRPMPEADVTPPKEHVVQVSIDQPIQNTINDTPSEPEVVKVSASDVKAGRTWLRILEHGQGPEIAISWPTGNRGAKLFAKMARCYGLTLALQAPSGRLYADTGRQGEAWDLNLDLYSGFMRQVGTWHAPAERRAIQEIHARHRGLRGTPVRLFPRRVDARLLAGLGQIIGNRYAKASSIRAHYVLQRDRLFVENIYVDGETILGKIDLSPSAKCVNEGEI